MRKLIIITILFTLATVGKLYASDGNATPALKSVNGMRYGELT